MSAAMADLSCVTNRELSLTGPRQGTGGLDWFGQRALMDVPSRAIVTRHKG
jgi:hypothetical protein